MDRERRRNAGQTEMLEMLRGLVVICVWEEEEEDVCGKKKENGRMGNLEIFGVC